MGPCPCRAAYQIASNGLHDQTPCSHKHWTTITHITIRDVFEGINGHIGRVILFKAELLMTGVKLDTTAIQNSAFQYLATRTRNSNWSIIIFLSWFSTPILHDERHTTLVSRGGKKPCFTTAEKNRDICTAHTNYCLHIRHVNCWQIWSAQHKAHHRQLQLERPADSFAVAFSLLLRRGKKRC